MDPVSNIDGLVLLLRQRLLDRARTTNAGRAERKSATGEPKRGGLDSVTALISIEGVDDRQLGRTLLQTILADQFGASLINDARFQQMIDRVSETLQSDPKSAQLLSAVLVELRNAAQ